MTTAGTVSVECVVQRSVSAVVTVPYCSGGSAAATGHVDDCGFDQDVVGVFVYGTNALATSLKTSGTLVAEKLCRGEWWWWWWWWL